MPRCRTAALRQERSFIDNHHLRSKYFRTCDQGSEPTSMMETSRETTSAVPPTADIVGHRGHVRKVPPADIRHSPVFPYDCRSSWLSVEPLCIQTARRSSGTLS